MVANPSHFRLQNSRVPHFSRGDYVSNGLEEDVEEYESINDECCTGDISPVEKFTKTGEVTIENPQNNPSLAKFHSYFAASNSNVGTPYMNISHIRETDEEDLDEDSSPGENILKPAHNIVINQ